MNFKELVLQDNDLPHKEKLEQVPGQAHGEDCNGVIFGDDPHRARSRGIWASPWDELRLLAAHQDRVPCEVL